MLPRIVLSLAAAALLCLPAAADGSPLADLVGTTWQLTALDGQPVEPAVASTLVVSEGSIGGNGGCNTYGGDLSATPSGIAITNVFSTMMACDGLQQEQAFFAALEATDDFEVVDGNLRLLDAGSVVAEFAPKS